MSDVGAQKALYGKLSADTTLRGYLGTAGSADSGIYDGVAPDIAGTRPFVVIQKVSGIPGGYGMGGSASHPTSRAYGWNDETWMVKAVDHSPTALRAGTISDRIALLLDDPNPSPPHQSGGTVTYCRRDSDISYSEVVDGETYFHRGANYRIIVNPT